MVRLASLVATLAVVVTALAAEAPQKYNVMYFIVGK
jgi:hypothetical protein